MTRNRILVATLAVLTVGLHAAEGEYRWELGLGYGTQTVDSDPEFDATDLGGRVRYQLFAPVTLGQSPWEEAEFLEHSTWLEARVGRVTQESGPLEADGLRYGVAGRYAAKDVPVAVEASLDLGSVEDDDFGITLDTVTWEVRAGYWVMPNLIAGLGYSSATSDLTSEFDSTEETDTAIFAWGKWVHPLTADLDLNLEAEAGRTSYEAEDEDEDGDNLAATLRGDLYLMKRYGIGVLAGTESGDVAGEEGRLLGVRGSAWFTEHIGVRVEYATFAARQEDELDTDTISGELVGRF